MLLLTAGKLGADRTAPVGMADAPARWPACCGGIASFGLRGEVFIPVPCVLRANPYLLGYYRLLLGLSQKETYNKGPFGRFKAMEERGEIPGKLCD